VAFLVRAGIEPVIFRAHHGRVSKPLFGGVIAPAMHSLASRRFAYTFPSIERDSAGQLALTWEAGGGRSMPI
jgi:hypothetical protein